MKNFFQKTPNALWSFVETAKNYAYKLRRTNECKGRSFIDKPCKKGYNIGYGTYLF